MLESLRSCDVADLNDLKKQRDDVLIAVYQLTDGNRMKSVHTSDVVDATSYEKDVIDRTVRWLVDRDLLAFESLAGDFTVTPTGSDEAERLLADQVDLAAVVLTTIERRALEAFTREVREALETAELDNEARADAEAQLATIEAQQRSPNPRRAVIGFALRALKAAAGVVVGGVLSNTAYDVLRSLMH